MFEVHLIVSLYDSSICVLDKWTVGMFTFFAGGNHMGLPWGLLPMGTLLCMCFHCGEYKRLSIFISQEFICLEH